MGFKIAIVLVLLALAAESLRTQHHFATINCVSPSQFNASTGQCDCVNGSVANATTKKCECPPVNPWLKDGVCYPCNFPNVFDTTQNQCYTCPDGFKYNLQSHMCDRINCENGKTYTTAQQKCLCPASTPYDYDNQCN